MIEKRPKLLKDWTTPLANKGAKAGTIGTKQSPTMWEFGRDLWLYDSDAKRRTDWVTFVDFCTECEREVCHRCGDCPVIRHSNSDTRELWCHGRTYGTITIDGKTFTVIDPKVEFETLRRVLAGIDDRLIALLYDKLEAERKRREVKP